MLFTKLATFTNSRRSSGVVELDTFHRAVRRAKLLKCLPVEVPETLVSEFDRGVHGSSGDSWS